MLIFLIFYKLITISFAVDYCTLCPNGSHTMCLYPYGPAIECLEYRSVFMNKQVKQYIVDIHNDIRNHVASGLEYKGKLGRQPPAANMMQLTWDDELAEIAQRWADQCIKINGRIQHDVCKKTERFEIIGQNILTAVTNGTELPELAILILNWYKQVSSVIPSDVDFFSGVKRGQFLIGQYTQLVWANTRYVGCGMTIYKEAGNDFFDQRLVCNYAPGGNVIGQPIYQKGIPCSKCPSGSCDSFREALCAGLTADSRNVTNDKFNKWLGKELSLCVRIPDDKWWIYVNACSKFFTNNDTGNIETEEMDMLVYRNVSLIENVDTAIYIQIPVDFNSEYVIDLRKDDYQNLMNNENYTNLMKSLKIYLSTNNSVLELENELIEEDNKVVVDKKYIRVKRNIGKWYNGRCRCDKIYRQGKEISKDDSSTKLTPLHYVIVVAIIIIVFFME